MSTGLNTNRTITGSVRPSEPAKGHPGVDAGEVGPTGGVR